MPRAIWSGAISFGLVTIPIKLYSAVSRKGVRFNQLDSENGARIKQLRVNADTGDEVPYERIVKGYEIGGGRYVTLTDDELGSLDPAASRSIDLQEFVLEDEIDPIFYDSAYYLAPDPIARKAYALLAHSMEQAGRVGIATFVMRSKKYVCALRPHDGYLTLSTMVFADEINPVEGIDGLADIEDVELSDAEVAMAEQLIASLSHDFEPAKYEDDYRNQVLELIDRKANGEEIVVSAEAPAAAEVVDLMAALEASVAAAKQARGRHPSAGDGDAATAGAPAATKPATKKAAAKKAAPTKTAAKKPAAKKAYAKKAS